MAIIVLMVVVFLGSYQIGEMAFGTSKSNEMKSCLKVSHPELPDCSLIVQPEVKTRGN